jgi:competence protein ComEC
VHVIAISGMHMAMIYGSMIWVLFRIPFFKRKKIGAYVIAILTMWLFACLTGLPPSVTRSAIMFTFIGVGEIMDRKMSIYNNLAASAFCLLCYNPFWLLDVGFQLSYTAVLSMLLFFEKFYQLNYFSNYVLDKIWAMIAGTLSAQVLTIPIIIYYFHQFPLLFLVSNLIAIPMTGFILYAEIGLVVFSWFKPLAKIIGVIISKSIFFLNYVVLKISQLSFVSWTAIQVNEWQVVLLFLCIVFLGIYIYSKKANIFIASLGAICMFLISTLFIRKENLQQQKMIVYSLPKQSALGFVNGNQIYFTNDSITKGDDKFTFTPSKIYFQTKETTGNFIQKEITEPIQFYSMANKKVAVVNSINISTTQPIEIDYLILSQKCLATKEWINNNFKTKQIIVDNTIPFWKINQLKENLKEVSTPIHYVSEKGAFVVDL